MQIIFGVKASFQDCLIRAGWLLAILLMTGCVGHDSRYDDKASAQLRKCHILADYISAQYITHAHDLPVQHDGPIGFVDIKVPSLYDVTFQHKGHQGVIEECLARQIGT